VKKIVIAVLTVALLVPTVALAGNKNRFEGDGTSKGDKNAEITFRVQKNGKKVEDFRVKDFKFNCNGRKDFKSNWIKFDKKFKIKKNKDRFNGKQSETENGATLKGKANGRFDNVKDDKDYDEAHGRVQFEVRYDSSVVPGGATCKSGKIKWEADR
jgi:hypothetical protein